MKCFDHVSNTIDEIYKALARNQSAQVIIFVDDILNLKLSSFNIILSGLRSYLNDLSHFRLSLDPRTRRNLTSKASTTIASRPESVSRFAVVLFPIKPKL